MGKEPLVSVVTPVYNGEAFLAECIESVLAQTLKDFEYVIVNNCSRDRTLEIALEYAKTDARIRVVSNTEFVGVIANHNIAFRLISPQSRYCKVVSGDDWLFPECLERMVALGDAHPSAAIVGSYQLSGCGADGRRWRVRWTEVPYSESVIPGQEICRLQLLGAPYVFGTPTSILYRSDIVRREEAFYPNISAEADTSACYKYLRDADFGFVHQVLSYERVHEVRVTTTSQNHNAYLSSWISDLMTYGSFYMSEAELKKRLKTLLNMYYKFLATRVVDFRDREFWPYHRKRLSELGYPLDRLKLSKAVGLRILDVLLNPKQMAESLLRASLSKGSA